MNVQLISGNTGPIRSFNEGTEKFGINFGIAQYTGKDKPTRWIRCIAFGATAMAIQKLGKGVPLVLTNAQIFGDPEANRAQEITLPDGTVKWLKEEDTWVVNGFAVDSYYYTKEFMTGSTGGQAAPQQMAPQQAAPQQMAPQQAPQAAPQQQFAQQAPQQFAQQAPQQPQMAPAAPQDFDDDDVPF